MPIVLNPRSVGESPLHLIDAGEPRVDEYRPLRLVRDPRSQFQIGPINRSGLDVTTTTTVESDVIAVLVFSVS
ncbi:MAG: hypothetical protein ACR2HJ_06200 [Fimbriimonadales bacterium]